MSVTLCNDAPNVLINLLADDQDWVVRVFGKSTVQNYNSAAFFLQLLSCGLLEIESRQREVVIGLARDGDENYRYENRLNWEGFEFRFKERGSTHSFPEFLSYFRFEELKLGRQRERYHRVSRKRGEEREH